MHKALKKGDTMNRFLLWLCGISLAVSAAASTPAQGERAAGSTSLSSLARRATAPDQKVSTAAIASLRAEGYAGLSALLESGGPASPRICWSEGSSKPADHWGRWCAAVDAVAAQRDASVSGLYWYTDLEKAKEAARLSGKPILSLRLLGRLDEELSCANSRFFRVALYGNREIAPILRDRFVLHWKSERPVPRITIDFGDGRRIERTITGNSIHYLLDAEGRPLDALPGLYGPAAFRRWLIEAEQLAGALARSRSLPLQAVLASFHAEKFSETSARWETDRAAAGIAAPRPAAPTVRTVRVSASAALPAAATKMIVERPLLKAFSPLETDLRTLTESTQWEKLARLHAEEARLDATSRALFARESASAHPAQAVVNFEASMALDTVRNEYLLHARLHQWFATGSGVWNLERLNEKVYAELFLTPRSDPWLGLVPTDTYTALSDGGLRGFATPLNQSR
jgi:hypothetical protein